LAPAHSRERKLVADLFEGLFNFSVAHAPDQVGLLDEHAGKDLEEAFVDLF
jgi:hypothetical protein